MEKALVNKKSRILKTALGILEDRPEGVKFSDLQRSIHANDPTLNLNTIAGNIYNLDETQAGGRKAIPWAVSVEKIFRFATKCCYPSLS